MAIKTIGVIGAGTMGNGIAQVCAVAGLDVVMVDISADAVQRGLGVVAGSLVQGGYLNTTPAQQLGVLAPIALETNRGLSNVRGTLALSRKARADTATSQFYFNLADNPQLDYASPERPGYAVFGRVVQGLEVLDAIGQVPTNLLYGLPHFPVSDVVITSAVQIQ